MSERVMTCIECPRGCRMVLIPDEGGGYVVRGNRCRKGADYALREEVCPMRALTTTVRTVFPDMPRLSVRTSSEVPLKDIFFFMDRINQFTLKERVFHGCKIPLSFPGDVCLIVTGDPRRETGTSVYWRGDSDTRDTLKEDS